MSNVSEILKRMGGVVEENGVTYVTHPTPPTGDNSQKIATTAWVKNITDGLESSVSGGMFPKVSAAAGGNQAGYAPSGGTWWCYFWGSGDFVNGSYAGGSKLPINTMGKLILCIKIA